MNFHNELDKLIKTCDKFKELGIIEIQSRIFGSQQNYGKRIKKPENLKISEILEIKKQTGLGVKQIVSKAIQSVTGEEYNIDDIPKIESSSLLEAKEEHISLLKELLKSKDEIINHLKNK